MLHHRHTDSIKVHKCRHNGPQAARKCRHHGRLQAAVDRHHFPLQGAHQCKRSRSRSRSTQSKDKVNQALCRDRHQRLFTSPHKHRRPQLHPHFLLPLARHFSQGKRRAPCHLYRCKPRSGLLLLLKAIVRAFPQRQFLRSH